MSASVCFLGSVNLRLMAENLTSHGLSCFGGDMPVREAMQLHDAIWIELTPRITADDIPDNPRCRFIACPATGLDHIDVEACQRAGIEVISLKGERDFLDDIHATAEHTIGLMLALLRRIPDASWDAEQGNWRRDRFIGRELHGKTVGIVGYGRVGKQVAGICRAFGCRVLACNGRGGLDELLRESDIISLHVPLDENTRHMIGDRELAKMKRAAVLINTARGAVIDEQAVATAILGRVIAGVAVDVLEHEPDIADSPLLGLARSGFPVLITPHIGGKTHESCEKTEVFIAHKLVEALERAQCHA